MWPCWGENKKTFGTKACCYYTQTRSYWKMFNIYLLSSAILKDNLLTHTVIAYVCYADLRHILKVYLLVIGFSIIKSPSGNIFTQQMMMDMYTYQLAASLSSQNGSTWVALWINVWHSFQSLIECSDEQQWMWLQMSITGRWRWFPKATWLSSAIFQQQIKNGLYVD